MNNMPDGFQSPLQSGSLCLRSLSRFATSLVVFVVALISLMVPSVAFADHDNDRYNYQIGDHGDEGLLDSMLRYTPQNLYDYLSPTADRSINVIGNASFGYNGGITSIAENQIDPTYTMMSAYSQYTNNRRYTFPGLFTIRSTRGAAFDWTWALAPFFSSSNGASGSEYSYNYSIAHALGVMNPAAKEVIRAAGLTMPTLHMLYLRSRPAINSDSDYLTPQAHQACMHMQQFSNPIWEAADNRMFAMAASIRADNVPPMIQIVSESDTFGAALGRDYFDAKPGVQERYFDTKVAISRLFLGREATKSIVVNADSSYDLNGRPLTYQWSVVRGDPAKTRITYLNASHSRVRIDFDYQPWTYYPFNNQMTPGNLAAVAAVVHNGSFFSAPAYVSVYAPPSEARSYDPAGRVTRIDYTQTTGAYRSPANSLKVWSNDVFRYDGSGALTGWTRDGVSDFTKEGYLVITRDSAGNPTSVDSVRYTMGSDYRTSWSRLNAPFAYNGAASVSLAADSYFVQSGTPVTLRWSVPTGSSGSVDGGIGTVTTSGYQAVSPTTTTTYTLRVGNQTAAVTINVVPPPNIVSFSADQPVVIGNFQDYDVATGQHSTVLRWSASNAQRVTLNGAPVLAVDSMAVVPTQTTTYTLTAFGSNGSSVSRTITVGSVNAPTGTLSASIDYISAGQSTALKWDTANATEVSITPTVGTVAVTGTAPVSPQSTTTYTLNMRGPSGFTSTSITIHVNESIPAPIVRLDATPNPQGGYSLRWATTYASSVQIDSGVGAVSQNGSATVNPSVTTTYTLQGSGPGGTSTTALTLVPVSSGGTGLLALYADGTNFESPRFYRVDATSNFDWGAGSPASSVGSDSFSVRWTGQIIPPTSELYTFYAQADDRVRVWVNGEIVSDNTVNGGAGAPVALIGGQAYSYKVEFVEYGGNANVSTGWSTPTIPRQAIPTSQLTPTGYVPKPTLTASVAPTNRITWSTSDATQLIIDNGVGSVALNGSTSVSPAVVTSYTLTARGPGGTSQATVEAYPTSSGLPTIQLAASQTGEIGATTTISWSTTNATAASFDGGIGAVPTKGSFVVNPVSPQTYTLTASNSLGSTTKTVVIVPASAPAATLTATTTSLRPGESSTLSWATNGATNVSIYPSVGPIGASGTVTVSPTKTTTYVLTATGPSGTSTRSVTINSAPDINTYTITASGRIDWWAFGATSITIDQGIGTVAASGSYQLPSLPTASTTYTITASNALGTSTRAVTFAPPTNPKILSFTANPSTTGAGQPVTLSWTTANTQSVQVYNSSNLGPYTQSNPYVGPANGSLTVFPTATSGYVLVASGNGPSATTGVFVSVVGGTPAGTPTVASTPTTPPIPTATATPITIAPTPTFTPTIVATKTPVAPTATAAFTSQPKPSATTTQTAQPTSTAIASPTLTATRTATKATTPGLTATPSLTPTATSSPSIAPSAECFPVDSKTSGSWPGAYGADGYAIAGLSPAYPSYASPIFEGDVQATLWAPTTSDPRALKRGPALAEGIGSAWITSSGVASLSLQPNIKDSGVHYLSLYFLTLDENTLSYSVAITNLKSGVRLATGSVTGVGNGAYLTCAITAGVRLEIVSNKIAGTVATPRVWISGLFFDKAPRSVPLTPSPTPTLVSPGTPSAPMTPTPTATPLRFITTPPTVVATQTPTSSSTPAASSGISWIGTNGVANVILRGQSKLASDYLGFTLLTNPVVGTLVPQLSDVVRDRLLAKWSFGARHISLDSILPLQFNARSKSFTLSGDAPSRSNPALVGPTAINLVDGIQVIATRTLVESGQYLVSALLPKGSSPSTWNGNISVLVDDKIAGTVRPAASTRTIQEENTVRVIGERGQRLSIVVSPGKQRGRAKQALSAIQVFVADSAHLTYKQRLPKKAAPVSDEFRFAAENKAALKSKGAVMKLIPLPPKSAQVMNRKVLTTARQRNLERSLSGLLQRGNVLHGNGTRRVNAVSASGPGVGQGS